MFILSKKRSIQEDDLLRKFFAVQPDDVDGLNNTSVYYYTTWCIKKLFGVYKISGVPDDWDIPYMMSRIFLDGVLCITDTPLGVIPLQTSTTGYNVWNLPTKCLIANPVLGTFERVIGTECAMIRLQYDFGTVWPIVNRYATLLAMCDAGISVNLINTKVAAIFGADNKAEAESYKRMYDQISEGRPAVFVGENMAKKLSERLLFNRVKESYIADQVEDLKQQIINDYLSDIGINNANTEKRERMVENEVMSNRQEVRSGAEHWLKTVNEGFDMANRLYGLELKLSLEDWNENGGRENESTEPA